MGKDAVGISGNSPEHLKRLRQVFAFVPPPQKIAIHRHSIPLWSREGEPPLDTYLIYRAYGFKGGQRWTATNPDDVRTGKTP
jgi:hypothetical protein